MVRLSSASFVACVLCTLSQSTLAARERVFTIHKHLETCASIAPFDRVLHSEDYTYFEGWSEEDFEEAARWSSSCPRSSEKLGPEDRLQDLAYMRAKIEADPNRHDSKPGRDCTQSQAYGLFRAQEAVIDDREGIAAARASIARERHVGELSGVIDMETQHVAGTQIQQWTEDLKADFAEYKSLGGTALTPQTVKHSVADPCKPK